MHRIKTEFRSGRIGTAIKEAKKLAVKLDVGIEFMFFNIPILVTKHSDEKAIKKEYEQAIKDLTNSGLIKLPPTRDRHGS